MPASNLELRALSYVVLAILLAVLAGCSGGGSNPAANVTPVAPTNGRLTISGFEWGYDPPAIILKAGEQVEIAFTNDGSTLHNFAVEDLPADVIESDSNGPLDADEGEVFVGSVAGREGILTFVPTEAGEYTFYCTVTGHKTLGMAGTLTVE